MANLISNTCLPSLPPTVERWSAYENWVMCLVRELDLDTPAARPFWWGTIYEPPAHSPFFALATTARISCSAILIDHTNTAHRDAFLVAMRSEAAITGRATAKIADSGPLTRVAAMRVESNLGVDLGTSDLEAGASAVSRGRPTTPGGSPHFKRPCPLCLATTHPSGHRCTVKTTCTVCDSSAHCDGACWLSTANACHTVESSAQIAGCIRRAGPRPLHGCIPCLRASNRLEYKRRYCGA